MKKVFFNHEREEGEGGREGEREVGPVVGMVCSWLKCPGVCVTSVLCVCGIDVMVPAGGISWDSQPSSSGAIKKDPFSSDKPHLVSALYLG